MENNSNAELIEKAKQAKTPEELLALAKENNYEFNEEQANAYFEQLNKSGELSDNELENVAGGGCYSSDGRLIVTQSYCCENWTCKNCGDKVTFYMNKAPYHMCHPGNYTCGKPTLCIDCDYLNLIGGNLVCNHPANRG